MRAGLLGPSLVFPFENGELCLGRWQEICFVCFDNRPRERTVIVQTLGVAEKVSGIVRLLPEEDDLMKPVLQLALDFVDLPRAMQVAEEALAGGADWLEAGTPLIKSEGLEAIREIKSRWPDVIDRRRHEDHGRRSRRGRVRRQGRRPAWSACWALRPTPPSRSASRRPATTAPRSSWT